MKFKKQMLILPMVAVMSLGTNFVFANTNTEANPETEVSESRPEIKGLISKVTGEVTEIISDTIDDVTTYALTIQGDDETNSIINISEDTVFIIDGEILDIDSIEVGMEITVHYQGSGIISGPLVLDLTDEDLVALENEEDVDIEVLNEGTPRYLASAIVANDEDSYINVHVDVFNEDLVSSDFYLRLTIDEDTVIVDRHGEIYEDSIENKKLAVIYVGSTRSMPAIPIQPTIVVLGEVEYSGDKTEEVKQPLSMLDFLPEFARGNSRNQVTNYDNIIEEPIEEPMEEPIADVMEEPTEDAVETCNICNS